MDRPEDQQSSNNESQDLIDVTDFTNPSPGPALVSSSSLDSSLTVAASASDQRPSEATTIKPSDLIESDSVSAIRDVAGESPVSASGASTQQQQQQQHGVGAGGILDGGDFGAQTGPSIGEAEAYADDLTRELLNDTNNLVRSAPGSELLATVATAAQEVVDSAIVQATETIGLKQHEDAATSDIEPSSKLVASELQDSGETKDESQVVEEISIQREKESQDEHTAAIEDASLHDEKEYKPMDDTEPIVKEGKTMNVAIGPVTYQFAADSLEESQIEPFNNAEVRQDAYENAQKIDLDSATSATLDEEETKENTEALDEFSSTKKAERQEEANLEELRPIDDTWTKLTDITNNQILHQTFKTAVNTSQQSQDNEEEEDEAEEDMMEFTKNYSDDLLMGASEQARATNNEAPGPDLADFELPPYNGSSSSGSEKATSTEQHTPVKQRDSSQKAATQASSSSTASVGLVPSDLTAVKNILVSSYSKVAHVFHWKKPIESGIIFSIGLTLIAALTFFSIISVVAYSALGIVLASGLIRIYKTGMKALNRSPETPVDHIWEKVLSLNVSMSPERMHEIIDSSHANLNASLVYFKQVLLVEDKVATFKFFLFLYSLTYIGAWFNGMTLITIIYVSLFTAPIIYDKNKAKIDEYLNLATNQISSAISMVTGKVTALLFGAQSGAVSSKKQK